MKAAIVGYGNIGPVHARCLAELGQELVAVCDRDEEALRRAPACRHYTDLDVMLAEEEIDVLHICTPHYLHAPMILQALEKGIHVLCEKPLCISEDQITAILRAERQSGGQLGVCLQNRYNAANRYVKEYLRDKRQISAVGSVTWKRDAAYYRSGPWRGKWETEGGGVLINQALHTLDLAQWMAGMPSSLRATVSCLTLADEIEVEDTAVILGGERFAFYATNGGVCDCPVELTLRADGEWIKVMPHDVLINGRHIHFDEEAVGHGKACYGSGHAALIADFYDCAATGRRFAINGAEGAKVVRLILAAYRSEGRETPIGGDAE